MTIRERLSEVQNRASSDAYHPGQAAEDIVTLSALLGNVVATIREREMAFKRLLLQKYSEEKTANRAKLVAETSPEYLAYREAKDTLYEMTELTRSLKSFIRESQEERRYSGNQ